VFSAFTVKFHLIKKGKKLKDGMRVEQIYNYGRKRKINYVLKYEKITA
jgi:hypothetical protein